MRRFALLLLFLFMPSICWGSTADTVRELPEGTDQIPAYRPSLAGSLGPANPDAYFRVSIQNIIDNLINDVKYYTVSSLPETADEGTPAVVVDGESPCDSTTGGGEYKSLFIYYNDTWNCVSGEEATIPTQILADDTEITITDNGVDAGSIAVEVDGTTVATFTEAGTTLGPIAATATITADNNYSSTQLLTGANGGETISQWQTVYFDGTAGEYMLADANASGKWPAAGIAVAATTDGNPIQVMVSGFARNDVGWNWTPGAAICLSETAGGVIACSDASICSADGDCAQRIGTAITADIVYFDFEQGWGECNGS